MKRTNAISILIILSQVLKAQQSVSHDSVAVIYPSDNNFRKVEVESEFPGGTVAWNRFISQTLVYPSKAFRKKIEGTVVVQFIIEKDGRLSDIEIIDGPKELSQAVLDMMKQSPNWRPAWQGGKKVRSYKKQPIHFKLEH